MDNRKRSILTALALGDGYISKPDQWGSVSIEIEHCEKQKSYIEYKYDLLHSVVGGKKVKLHRKVRNRKDTELVSFRFRKADKYFRVLRKRLYKNNIKVFSKTVLEYLDDLGIAILVMDDGSLHKVKKNGEIKSVQFKLSLCSTKEQCELFKDLFKKRYDSNMSIRKHMVSKSGVQLYSLICGTKEYRKIAEEIEPYVIDSMKYKVLLPRVQSNQNG